VPSECCRSDHESACGRPPVFPDALLADATYLNAAEAGDVRRWSLLPVSSSDGLMGVKFNELIQDRARQVPATGGAGRSPSRFMHE
jgi:hypothetical protein